MKQKQNNLKPFGKNRKQKSHYGGKDMDYDKSKKVVISNKAINGRQIIDGKQSMSVHSAKLLRLLITQVAREDRDFKTYQCDIKDIAKFLDIEKNMYRDIKKICEELMKAIIYLKDEDDNKSWTMLHWVSMAKLKNGILTLRLSDEVKQCVLELKNYFTQYKLENILTFKSFYSIRIYEILKCETAEKKRNNIKVEISELKEKLECTKKYKATKDFNKNVIAVAIKEINEKSDITVTAEYKKTSRSITHIIFHVQDKNIIQTTAHILSEEQQQTYQDKRTEKLAGATNNEFSDTEMQMIIAELDKLNIDKASQTEYLHQKYIVLNYYTEKSNIQTEHRFTYFLKMLQNEVRQQSTTTDGSGQESKKISCSYDISMLDGIGLID